MAEKRDARPARRTPPPTVTLPAAAFVENLGRMVDREELSDAEFRQLVRDYLPFVERERTETLH